SGNALRHRDRQRRPPAPVSLRRSAHTLGGGELRRTRAGCRCMRQLRRGALLVLLEYRGHGIARSLAPLLVNPPNVLAHDPESDERHADEEEGDAEQREET